MFSLELSRDEARTDSPVAWPLGGFGLAKGELAALSVPVMMSYWGCDVDARKLET